ncbi:MAG: hypothetical protein L6R19_02765 [Alphaproteobacteria bacterium]|nr:hypothetical protein [Alphaproteobacteria bacterium]
MHESILVYRGFRYLKLSLWMVAIAVVAYIVHQPTVGPPNGGTALGYTLGTIGVLLIVWLAWFGVRKRRYGLGKVKLEDWLSAHVYLGLGLIVVATLHTGFQFGWNVHTLAYSLMIFVIVSGIFGIIVYVRFPRLMTENRRGSTQRDLLAQIAELNAKAREISVTLGDDIHNEVMASADKLALGGGALKQLSGRDRNCPVQHAVKRVGELVLGLPKSDAEKGRTVLSLLARKLELVERVRRDLRYKALMDIWLYVHVPVTFALLASLAAHIVSVFFYW